MPALPRRDIDGANPIWGGCGAIPTMGAGGGGRAQRGLLGRPSSTSIKQSPQTQMRRPATDVVTYRNLHHADHHLCSPGCRPRRQRPLHPPQGRKRLRLAARPQGRQLAEQRLRWRCQLGSDSLLPVELCRCPRCLHRLGRFYREILRQPQHLPPGSHAVLPSSRSRWTGRQVVDRRRRCVVQGVPRATQLRLPAHLAQQRYVPPPSGLQSCHPCNLCDTAPLTVFGLQARARSTSPSRAASRPASTCSALSTSDCTSPRAQVVPSSTSAAPRLRSPVAAAPSRPTRSPSLARTRPRTPVS